MNAVFWDNRYIAFYDNGDGDTGAIVVDFSNDQITTLDLYPTAAYVDPKTDILYYVLGTDEVLLLEDGTGYPSRVGVVLLETGKNLLLE
jgi:hypothetical protein